jgi:hypothetical protein
MDVGNKDMINLEFPCLRIVLVLCLAFKYVLLIASLTYELFF